MGAESVPVARTVFQADTLEVFCDTLVRILLPSLTPMEGKSHTTYRSYSTNVYIENHSNTTFKPLGKTVTNSS